MEKIKEKILRYFDRTWEPQLHNKEVAQIMNRYEEDVIAIIDGKEPKGIAGLTLKESMLDYEYSTQQDLKSTILKKLPEENRGLNDDYRLGFNNCREKIKSLIDSL